MFFRWLWDRLTGRQAQQQQRWYGGRAPQRRGGWGRQAPPSYWRNQSRSRGGFWGPFPYWSTRTRGGSRVTVSGCCLPLALSLSALPVIALRALFRR
jgi:hypothetical protein